MKGNVMKYLKGIAALAVVLLSAVLATLADGVFTKVDAVEVLIAALTTGLVVLKANTLGFPYWKIVIAVSGAVAQALTSAITDGVFTTPEFLMVGQAFAGALMVYLAPNEGDAYDSARAFAHFDNVA